MWLSMHEDQFADIPVIGDEYSALQVGDVKDSLIRQPSWVVGSYPRHSVAVLT